MKPLAVLTLGIALLGGASVQAGPIPSAPTSWSFRSPKSGDAGSNWSFHAPSRDSGGSPDGNWSFRSPLAGPRTGGGNPNPAPGGGGPPAATPASFTPNGGQGGGRGQQIVPCDHCNKKR